MPKDIWHEVLKTIHSGYKGELKCILLAREYVFWPGISNDIRQIVKDCHLSQLSQCCQSCNLIFSVNHGKKLGTLGGGGDIFDFNGRKYLMIVY